MRQFFTSFVVLILLTVSTRAGYETQDISHITLTESHYHTSFIKTVFFETCNLARRQELITTILACPFSESFVTLTVTGRPTKLTSSDVVSTLTSTLSGSSKSSSHAITSSTTGSTEGDNGASRTNQPHDPDFSTPVPSSPTKGMISVLNSTSSSSPDISPPSSADPMSGIRDDHSRASHTTRFEESDSAPSTTSLSATTENPSLTWPSSFSIIPVTTPVDKPKPTDGGYIVPCMLWFFSVCIPITWPRQNPGLDG